jgi:hypothetical protein
MCCFTQAVDCVSNTQIFARGLNGRQVIVYSMAYAAQNDLAMVLPLPVPPGLPDDAVRFISLEDYPKFFVDIRRAFPDPDAGVVVGVLSAEARPLVVHAVGAFEASFVPTLGDFERLDARFRIPPAVWDELPTYQDYRFAVFKLRGKAGPRTVHPMAFEFPRRHPGLLYFPTLHVHDRTVHPGAKFDHVLYCQSEPGWDDTALIGWLRSNGPAAHYVDVSKTRELLDSEEHLFRLPLRGFRQNIDTWVSVNATTYPEVFLQ